MSGLKRVICRNKEHNLSQTLPDILEKFGLKTNGSSSWTFTKTRINDQSYAGKAGTMDSEKLSKIREFVVKIIESNTIPGVSVAVVHQGQVLLSEGFGVKDYNTKAPVTEKTRFCIGSITKGFTSALLASLLPQYGINWNTPLKRIFDSPNFRLPDPYMTENACLRDLLAHKMGIELGESDFGWLCSSFKRDQMQLKLKHLPLSSVGFRVSMIYSNYMYALAGQVAEKLTGCKWEELVRERFFQLLGMDDADFINELATETADIATPHMLVEGHPVEISLDVHRGCDCIGPAGSIVASARDMAKWMQFLLNKGCLGDIPIIPKAQLQECWKPQFALPCGKPEWDGYVYQPQFPVTETRDTYGFGWYRGSYRGYKMVAHAGELVGYDSLVTLYPDLDLGIYTSFSGPGGERAFIGNQLVHYFITDTVLDLDKWLTSDNVSFFPEPWLPREKYYIPRRNTQILKGINSTRPLVDYVGTYRHGFLGDISLNIDSSHAVLNMYHGKMGQFKLHPNGEVDEFRIEGTGPMSFLHRLDLYAPSDWMMVRFCSMHSSRVDSCIVSLFESGPIFKKVDVIGI